MRRLAALFLVLLPLGFAPACGGGGGGGDPQAPCVKPGTLRALAIQGQPAPGTVGNFKPFVTGLRLDVAENGWAVFQGETDEVGMPDGVWVAEPDGTVRLVFREGEVVPVTGGGTITGFSLAKVNTQGHVLVRVSINGNTNGYGFALLTAQVIGGVVTGKNDVVFESLDMGPSGVSGTLSTLDDTRTFLVDDGRVFFAGTTTGREAFWFANGDGSNLQKLVQVGDTVPLVPGSDTLDDLGQVGVSRDGNRFAFVGDKGAPFNGGLWIGTTGSTTYAPIAGDGSGLVAASPARGGNVLDIWGGGPLLVYNGGAVVWKAVGDFGGTDDIVLIGNSTVPFSVMARTGDTAPSTGGATFGAIDLLQHRAECSIPMVRAALIGTTNGVDFAFFGLSLGPPALAMYEGRPAPADVGSQFTDQFPGVNTQGFTDIARNGAFAFASVLLNGVSGIFWQIPFCGTFTVAAQGTAAPAGGNFGAFSGSSTHTSANGVVLFRANLSAAGSGVFRQGP